MIQERINKLNSEIDMAKESLWESVGQIQKSDAVKNISKFNITNLLPFSSNSNLKNLGASQRLSSFNGSLIPNKYTLIKVLYRFIKNIKR